MPEPKIDGRRVINALSLTEDKLTSEVLEAVGSPCTQTGFLKYLKKLEAAGVVEGVKVKGRNYWKLRSDHLASYEKLVREKK